MNNAFHTASYHLPDRHALIIHGNYADYLIDYYLNQKENNVFPEPHQDEQLKQLFACLAVHITMRSPDESIAWTVHMQSSPPYSLFATGSSQDSFLVGQILSENIRHTDMNIFHSQVSRKKGSSSKSLIKAETQDIPAMVELFYKQSEQLQLKLELSKNSDEITALVAMPGVDQEWFDTNTAQGAFSALNTLNHKLLKECAFRYHCGCSADKLIPYLSSVTQETLDELYGEEEQLIANCPRCGKSFVISRDKLKKDS